MAPAQRGCPQCGSPVLPEHKFCPHCATPLTEGVSPHAPETPSSRTCEVCGRLNSHGGSFCESCGSKLGAVETGGANVQLQGRPEESGRARSRGVKGARRIEPWQMYAGGVILIILGYMIYTELVRVHPPENPHVHANVPQQSSAMLQEIERLRTHVEANPNDAGSLLRLANLLHDNSMRDRRLWQQAGDTYRKYLALKPDDPNARVDLGICYYELARLDTAHADHLLSLALTEMSTAYEANPSHQPAAFNLGIVNLFAGNVEESNRWFKKAVELNAESELGRRARNLLDQHTF